jgi:hypothetical protein
MLKKQEKDTRSIALLARQESASTANAGAHHNLGADNL